MQALDPAEYQKQLMDGFQDGLNRGFAQGLEEGKEEGYQEGANAGLKRECAKVLPKENWLENSNLSMPLSRLILSPLSYSVILMAMNFAVVKSYYSW